MRRVVLAAILAATAAVSGACSSSPFGSDEHRPTHAPAGSAAGPVPTSQQFDRPFPVAGESWDATVTLSNLRIVPASAYADTVLAVDVRAVQSAGQPEIGPATITAYSPSGAQFERIEDPAGLIPDPLVPTVMTSPGQEIRGMVAWKMPATDRIGRLEVTTPRTLASVTVTLQPVDPAVQTTTSSAS